MKVSDFSIANDRLAIEGPKRAVWDLKQVPPTFIRVFGGSLGAADHAQAILLNHKQGYIGGPDFDDQFYTVDATFEWQSLLDGSKGGQSTRLFTITSAFPTGNFFVFGGHPQTLDGELPPAITVFEKSAYLKTLSYTEGTSTLYPRSISYGSSPSEITVLYGKPFRLVKWNLASGSVVSSQPMLLADSLLQTLSVNPKEPTRATISNPSGIYFIQSNAFGIWSTPKLIKSGSVRDAHWLSSTTVAFVIEATNAVEAYNAESGAHLWTSQSELRPGTPLEAMPTGIGAIAHATDGSDVIRFDSETGLETRLFGLRRVVNYLSWRSGDSQLFTDSAMLLASDGSSLAERQSTAQYSKALDREVTAEGAGTKLTNIDTRESQIISVPYGQVGPRTPTGKIYLAHHHLDNGYIKLEFYDISNLAAPVKTFSGEVGSSSESVGVMAFSRDGTKLSYTWSYQVWDWDEYVWRSAAVVFDLRTGVATAVGNRFISDWHPDGNLAFSFTRVFGLDGSVDKAVPYLRARWTPDGQHLVGMTDAGLEFLDAKTLVKTSSIDLGEEVVDLDASYYGDRIAAVTKHGSVFMVSSPSLLVNSISLSPSSVNGGDKATCTVTLSRTAGANFPVQISDTSSAINTPPSVIVAAGQNKASFDVTTNAVSTSTTRHVQTIQGTVIRQAALTIVPKPLALSKLSISTPSLYGGNSCTAAVELTTTAPAGGAVISLADNTSAIDTPASVTVLAGKLTGSAVLATHAVSASTSRIVSATFKGVTKSVTVTLLPAVLKALSLTPTWVVGGNATTGTVLLDGKAASAGVAVTLSDNSSVLTTPPSLTVAGDSSSATFAVTTGAVSASTTRTVTASYKGVTKLANLTVVPATLAAVTISPSRLVGGNSAVGSAKMNGLSTSAVTIALASNSTVVIVPSSVTIPLGKRDAAFQITTGKVSSTSTRTVSANLGSITKTATITLDP